MSNSEEQPRADLPIEPIVDAIRQRHARMQEAANRAQLEAETRNPEDQAAFEGGCTARLVDETTGEVIGTAQGVSDLDAAPEGMRFERVEEE